MTLKAGKYSGQRAISYARASIGKNRGRQEDSTDRQIDGAIEYCDRVGLKLDLDYRIVDEGVSAFRTVTDKSGKQIAKNLHESALAKFTEDVKHGAFPNGVHLIVEKLDRMYRDDPMRATNHFSELLSNGVVIHTTMGGEKIYDASDKDPMILIQAVMNLTASHQYSVILSERQHKSRQRRIEAMKKDTLLWSPMGRKPEWIDEKQVGKIKTPYISDRNKAVIKMIFDLYTEQGMSSRAIADLLNEREIKTFMGKTWSGGGVLVILNSESVKGLITHDKNEPPFYYKELRVIEDHQFQLVKKQKPKRGSLGKAPKDHHIFSNKIFCGYCKREKRTKKYELEFEPSPLNYEGGGKWIRSKRANKNALANKVQPPARYYRCKSPECCSNHLDYQTLYEAFFSFIKELDFSSLIESDNENKAKIIERQILDLNSLIDDQKVIIIREENLIDSWIRNRDHHDSDTFEQMMDEASGKIALSKKMIKSLTNQKEDLIIQQNSLQNQESGILKHEKEIKELIEDTHDNHLWYAYEKLRVKEEVERNENGKILDDLMRIHDIEILLQSTKNDQETIDLEDEYRGLLLKYFSEEIARDEIALKRKMKLRALLNKYIKSIEYFAYGIPLEEPSPAKVYRNGKKSTFHYQRQRITEFVKSKNIFDPELKLTSEQKKKSKLTTQEYLDLFGLKTTQLYRNWNQEGCPKPSRNGATIQDMIDWYKKRNSHIGAKSAKERNNNILFQKFMSFRVEFSELCAKNTAKYVLPNPQDPTKGVAYKYNKSSRKAEWESTYGDTEIKLKRNPNQAVVEGSKIIYAEDDPFFYGKINFLLQRLQSNN